MQTRPTNIRPQTLRQAKAQYKKHGPRISSQEQRRLERSNELERRAEAIREAQQRRKKNAEKRKQREERVREERRRLNIKSPEPWISPRQTKVLNFFRCSKGNTIPAREEDNCKALVRVGEDQQEDTEIETEPETETEEEESSPCLEPLPGAGSQGLVPQKFESFTFSEDVVKALDTEAAPHSKAGQQKGLEGHVQIKSPDTLSNSQHDALLLIASEAESALPFPTQDHGIVPEHAATPCVKKRANSSPLMQRAPKRIPMSPEASLFSSFSDSSLLNGLEKMSAEQLFRTPATRQTMLQPEKRDPWEFELSTQDFCLNVS